MQTIGYFPSNGACLLTPGMGNAWKNILFIYFSIKFICLPSLWKHILGCFIFPCPSQLFKVCLDDRWWPAEGHPARSVAEQEPQGFQGCYLTPYWPPVQCTSCSWKETLSFNVHNCNSHFWTCHNQVSSCNLSLGTARRTKKAPSLHMWLHICQVGNSLEGKHPCK